MIDTRKAVTMETLEKQGISVSVPDEDCPNCNVPLRVDNGYMTCPNCGQTFGDPVVNTPDASQQPGNAALPKKVEQPLYKWSYDGHELTIWPVNEDTGRPHHIEITGLEFYKLAQGRVYKDADGNLEILVWEDRGNEIMQDEAIEAVEAYLQKKLGRGADYYSFQSEGGVYQKQDPNNLNWDEMLTAYMGYPIKTKKPNMWDKLRGKPEPHPLEGIF